MFEHEGKCMWFLTDFGRKIKKGTIVKDPETGKVTRRFNGRKQIYIRPDNQESGWHWKYTTRPVRFWE